MTGYGLEHAATIAAYVIFAVLFLAGLLWLLLGGRGDGRA